MTEGRHEGHGKESEKRPSKPIQDSIPVQEPAGALQDFTAFTEDLNQLKTMVADSRLNTVQRQEAATKIGRLKGNAYVTTLIQEKANLQNSVSQENIQRQGDSPPGHGIDTKFGTFWIVPDDTNESFAGVEGEQITESAFAILEEVWSKLESGTGNLIITQKDINGKDNAGFKNNMLTQFGKLLSRPTGRSVVVNLVAGATNKVTIRPSAAQIYGGGNAIRVGGADALEKPGGRAGSGSGTIIQIDPSLKDEDIKVNDKSGNEISDPVFIILGHELIHAQHNRAGRNRREQAATSGDYTNKEEEQTVATGPTTENDLRSEHGLKARHGSGGRDTR
ncbi:MAG: M91 family zinc metallopeptidase [Candidatus Promineifilaceae bacterium]